MIGSAISRVAGLLDGFASSAVLLREAARTSRRWQTYAARTGFSGALFGVLLLGIWASLNAPRVDASEMAWMGRAIFVAFSVVLMMMAIVLAPLITSSALIEETEDRTLEMLILSKLLPSRILSGKVLSRILLLLTVVFGALPVLAMVVTLGGVAPQAVVAVVVHTLVAIVLMGALGAFFGLFTKSPMLAMMASASYALPVFLLLPIGYVVSTGHPNDAVHFSLFGGAAAEDWSSPIALLSYLPSLAVIQVIGTRLFELKVSNADIRRAFAAETWSTRAWVIGLTLCTATGMTILPMAAVATYTLRYAGNGPRGWAQELGLVACVGVVWLWWVFAATLLTWALLRVGVDVVDALDAILGGRSSKKRDRRDVRVWANPVAWREARPAAWGSNGVPVIVTWLLIMLGMLQTGWWIIPGGSLAMGVMNTIAALGLTLWLANRTVEEERRSGALDVLLTTTMPSWRILVGKAAGVVVPTLPLLLLSLPFFAFGVPHLHMFDIDGGGPRPMFWLVRGVLTWFWTLPIWAVLLTGGMWTALRVRRRSGFAVAGGALAAALGVPTILGRLFAEMPLLAVPSRLIAPPLAGAAEVWHYGVAIAGWSVLAVATVIWTSIGLRRWLSGGMALLLALGLATSVARAQPVQLQDDFALVADPLADGVVRPGSWAAVRLRIANVGPNARATLSMTERSGTESREFARPVDLPQNVRKDAIVLYQPNSSGRERTVELIAAGRAAARTVMLRPARPEDATVAVVGTDMLGIQGIRATAGAGIPGPRPRETRMDDRTVLSGLVDPAAMPSHSAGWQAFDQVVWYAADPSAVTPAQVEALAHWVADGGHLLLTVVENWQVVDQSPLRDALPMRFEGTRDREDLDDVLRWLGGRPLDGAVPMATGTVQQLPGRSVFERLVTEDGTPVWITGTYGLGTVSVLTIDPLGGALKGNVPTEDLWRTLLSLPQPGSRAGGLRSARATHTFDDGTTSPWGDPAAALSSALHMDARGDETLLAGHLRFEQHDWGEDPVLLWEDEIRRWLSDIPGVAPLPMSWLLGFSAVYLLFIGPVDYFGLRLLRRQPWTWVTFPVTIVGFSTLALVGTAQMKGSQAMVSTLEVVDLLPGTSLWRGDAYVGVFATRHTRIGLGTTVADSVAEPLLNSGYTRETQVGGGFGPGRFTYTADTWTLGYARMAWIGEAPGGIRFDALPNGGWAVTNELPFALQDAELHLLGEGDRPPAGVYAVGPMSPGERKEILPADRVPFGADFGQEAGTLSWARYRLLDVPSSGRGYVEPDGSRFVLLALTERVTPLAVEGVRPIHREVTVLRAPLTPRFDAEHSGRATIPGLGGTP